MSNNKLNPMRGAGARPSRLAAALSLLLASAGASAQEADADATGRAVTLDSVVVTAQHKAENIQSVPIAITAVSGEKAKAEGRNTVQEAIEDVPNVEFKTSNRGGGFYIRGIGSRFYDSTAPVSVFFDGVYQSRSEVTNLGFLDIDRIEVLRGPQGTLYGRNNSGGTVNLISNAPVLGDSSGSALLQIGNYSQVTTEAAVNVPVSEIAALRIAAGSNSHDGYLSNGLQDEDSKAARAQLLLQPSPKVRFLLAADYAKNGGKGLGNVYLPTDSRSDPWTAPSYDTLSFAGNVVCGGDGAPSCSVYQDTENTSVRAQLDVDTAIGTVTALAAHQDFDMRYRQAFSYLYEDAHTPVTQSSAEVRLAAPADSPVSWVVGAYGLHIDNSGGWTRNYSFNSYSETVRSINESVAVFGQATWPLGADSRLTTGARYTRDSYESGTEVNEIVNIASGAKNKATWRLAYEHDLSADVMGFASLSTGYKQGGIGQSANTGAIYQYDPETVTALELGLKGDFADRRVRFNVSAFLYRYKGYQLDINYYPDPDSEVYETRTSNVPGTSRVAGLELEGNWLLSQAGRLDFTATYTDTSFADADVLLGASSTAYTSLAGRQLPSTPKWKATLGYTHTWELASGQLSGYVGATASDSYVADLVYFTYAQPDLFVQDAYQKYDAKLTYDSNDGRWSVSLYGNNLTNEATIQQANPAGPNVLGVISPPRTYGVTFATRF
ncbi:MAG: TonB-dependent receptor [Pseudoxanthomonas sp.]